MDHMRFSAIEPSSVILSKAQYSKKFKSGQDKSKPNVMV